uniref:Uncharacterized protein n=1 Tax=Arundo donax TaxID=35708 RepID=A0A0A9BA17_ARUDO
MVGDEKFCRSIR